MKMSRQKERERRREEREREREGERPSEERAFDLFSASKTCPGARVAWATQCSAQEEILS